MPAAGLEHYRKTLKTLILSAFQNICVIFRVIHSVVLHSAIVSRVAVSRKHIMGKIVVCEVRELVRFIRERIPVHGLEHRIR